MANLSAKTIAYINEYDGNALRALEAALEQMETLYVRVDYGEYGEIEDPTPVMCVGVHPIRWGSAGFPTMGFYPFRLPEEE